MCDGGGGGGDGGGGGGKKSDVDKRTRMLENREGGSERASEGASDRERERESERARERESERARERGQVKKKIVSDGMDSRQRHRPGKQRAGQELAGQVRGDWREGT